MIEGIALSSAVARDLAECLPGAGEVMLEAKRQGGSLWLMVEGKRFTAYPLPLGNDRPLLVSAPAIAVRRAMATVASAATGPVYLKVLRFEEYVELEISAHCAGFRLAARVTAQRV